MQVTIHEAKSHFSRLIAAVERDVEEEIARRDKPDLVILFVRAMVADRSGTVGGRNWAVMFSVGDRLIALIENAVFRH